ncbi:MAG: NAD-dependent epimerase/dehydratase family protein [Thermoanaerobaculia bacterium]
MTIRPTADGERALVTGAGGFLGSHLALALAANGYSVTALDIDLERLRRLPTPAHLELIDGDVTDPEVQRRALEGVGLVFHLAAAHLGVSQSEQAFRRINVGAVEGLVARSRETGVGRFVHCSSVGVYGRIRNPPADEETPCHPELVYERTKLEGESVVLDAMRSGLPAVILRPVWVYGPGCPRTEKLFRALRKGRFVLAGGGQNLRHCIYVRDMTEAFQRAAAADSAIGQVIVVGDDRAVTVRHLVDEMARLADVRRPKSVPLALLYVAALAAEWGGRVLGREPPISRRTLRFFTANTAFDTGRARALLGFEPRYDLAAGLAETYEQLYGSGAG